MNFSDLLGFSVDEVVSNNDVASSGIVMTAVAVRLDRGITKLEDGLVDGSLSEMAMSNTSNTNADKAETFVAGWDSNLCDYATASVVQSKEGGVLLVHIYVDGAEPGNSSLVIRPGNAEELRQHIALHRSE